MTPREKAVRGALLGCALGDSLGLAFEGAGPAVVERWMPGRLQHSFTPWGTGWASDDTDHSRIVLQALAADPTAGEVYANHLAWGIRWWFLSLPVGIGIGTARACIKLLCGYPAASSGVDTAGNGPVMRAPVLGAFAPDDDWLIRAVRITTRVTHTDPRAEAGALLVARMTHIARDRPVTRDDVAGMLDDGDVGEAVRPVLDGLKAGRSPRELVDPRGVTGFVLHTVPAVVAVVLAHGDDLEAALDTAIRMGGDTDTVAAIVGGVVGARGTDLPADWLDGFRDWPWTTAKLEALVHAAVEGTSPPTVAPIVLLKTPLTLGFALRNLAWQKVLALLGPRSDDPVPSPDRQEEQVAQGSEQERHR